MGPPWVGDPVVHEKVGRASHEEPGASMASASALEFPDHTL